MKVLCAKSPNLSHDTMQGWADALRSMGFDFVFWNMKNKPVFDAFDENEPDIFISSVKDVTRGIAKCLNEYPDTISLFHSSNFDSVLTEDVEYMDRLKEETGKPNYIFNFCHESRLDETLGGWKDKGYKTLNIMKAANTKLFYPVEKDERWGSDIAIVSDYKEYLNPYILPICYEGNVKTRIFGDGWPISQGIGRPEDKNIVNIFRSSKIILDIVEDIYETSDIPFNVIASGGFCLSNSITNLLDIPNFKTPQELQELIKYYNEHGKEAKQITSALQPIVSSNHTYIHRMSSLLNTIGLEHEVN